MFTDDDDKANEYRRQKARKERREAWRQKLTAIDFAVFCSAVTPLDVEAYLDIMERKFQEKTIPSPIVRKKEETYRPFR
jgi:hypothetical protein